MLVTSYRDMLAAAVGFGLLVMAGISSYRHVRRRLRYETWWVIHLYLYLALAMAFAHQIFTGVSFIGHPLVRALWIVVWAATAGLVLVFRVAQPAWRSLRHQLRVVEVRQEAPGVVSVVCQGRHLDRLAVSGGQFFHWHFLTKGMWWQGHPYSLSALPQPPYIRVTIKGLGDQSRAAASLRPGTRVAIEGPYGTFTDHARLREGVALFAAGVGITPVRALLEDLPPGWTRWSWSARRPRRTWCTGTRWPPWSGSVTAVCRRSSGHGTRSGSTPGCFGRSCPISHTVTCTSAGLTGSRPRSPTPRSGSGQTRSRSTQRRSVSDAWKGQTADAQQRRPGAVRRAPIVMTATVVGLIGVLAFHSRPSAISVATIPAAGAATTSPAASARPQGGTGTSGAPKTKAKAGASGATPKASSSGTPSSTRTAVGPQVNYTWGVLSVSVTVSGTKVTKVGIASLDDGGNPRSQSIDQNSIPLLEQQALAAQSANIQGVSGASYTSAGFKQSLQAALQQLGVG